MSIRDNKNLLVQFGVLWGTELADSRGNELKYSEMSAYDSDELQKLFENWANEYLVGNFDDTVEFFEDKLKELLAKALAEKELETEADFEFVRDLGDGFKVLKVFAERDIEAGYGDVYSKRAAFDMLAKSDRPLIGYCVVDGASKLVPDGCSGFLSSVSDAMREFEGYDFRRIKKKVKNWLEDEREYSFTLNTKSVDYEYFASLVKGLCDRHFPELGEAAFGSRAGDLFVFRSELVPTMFRSFRLDTDLADNKMFLEQTFPVSTAVQMIGKDNFVDVLSKHTAREYNSREEGFFTAIFYMLSEKFNKRYLGCDVDKVCRSIEQEIVENEVYELLEKAVVNKEEDFHTSPFDMKSAEYIEARGKIEDYLEKCFPELAEIVAGDGAVDLIFVNECDGFVGFYYNPDSNAGGQMVKYTFDEEQLQRIVAGEELMNVVAENTQHLSDVNTVHFFDSIFELMDKKAEGSFLGVMISQEDIRTICGPYLEKKMDLDEKIKAACDQVENDKNRRGICYEDLQRD